MLDILGQAALRMLLLTAVVQCTVWLLRLQSARLLLSAWTVVLVASIAMPVLPHLSPMRLPIASAVSRPLADGVVDLLQQPTPDRSAAASDDTAAEQDAPPPLRLWLTAIYVIVGCSILLRTMLGLCLSLRLLARAAPAHPAWALGHRVRISTDVTGPVTIAHTILLPTDAMDWPAEMQQAVLAHERAHVARWDFALLVMSQLNRALFWFNPLSWWLHRRLVTLTELASDDQAMAATEDRLGYAEILLEMGRRSGATSRGPAMARPSTLVCRIERIVQGQTKLHRISRPQQVLIAAGATGLSLAVASLTPDLTSDPVITLSSLERTVAPESLITPNSNIGPVSEASERVGSPTAGHAAVDPADREASQINPSLGRSSVSLIPALLAKTSVQPSLSTSPLARSDRRPLARAALAPPPVQAVGRRKPITTGQTGSSNGLDTKSLEEVREPPNTTLGTNITARASVLNERGESSSPDQVAREPQLISSNLEEIVGSTCTGTIAVGPRAWRSYGRQPDVAAGELVPAKAQFFRRADGTAWVRFNAFGQPPLDLPARFGRNGVTWTGQYGISYALQAWGGNHLAGLAALIANDSAGLNFTCGKSANLLL
ncbi:MAG: M56 family metallopeptidase [Janthinobacterium lividum]